jgi:hypothetical protein
MPLNRKNRTAPRVTRSLIIEPPMDEIVSATSAEQPVLDELSVLRAQVAAVIAQEWMHLRSSGEELIREIEDEMAPVLDPTRVHRENAAYRKWALEEKKMEARQKRLDEPFLRTKD